MEESQLKRSLHGISITASGSKAVLSALGSRLGSLPANANTSPWLTFEFQTAATTEGHLVRKPEGKSRAFYAPAVGEALYFPEDDLLYLDYDGCALSLSHPGDGWGRISLLEPELDQLWLATHPLFTLPLLEMMKRRGRFNVHAACFARDGCGLMLAGTSGAGKSTLAIALLRSGLDFMGDDMVFMQRSEAEQSKLRQSGELELLAFPEKIDVSDNTVGIFRELHSLRGKAKRSGFPKHEIEASGFFSTSVAWRAKPMAIVFPQIAHGHESRLTPIGGDEAFFELAPNVLLTEARSTEAHFNVLADLAKTVPAYRLSTGTDFDDVSSLLKDLIG